MASPAEVQRGKHGEVKEERKERKESEKKEESRRGQWCRVGKEGPEVSVVNELECYSWTKDSDCGRLDELEAAV